jgi:hypothetical protein
MPVLKKPKMTAWLTAVYFWMNLLRPKQIKDCRSQQSLSYLINWGNSSTDERDVVIKSLPNHP